MEGIALQKLKGINVKEYKVTREFFQNDDDEEGEGDDMIGLHIEIEFKFDQTSSVKDFTMKADVTMDWYDYVADYEVSELSLGFNKGFFVALTEDPMMLLKFVNEILPYSFNYYEKQLPELRFEEEEECSDADDYED